MEETWNIEEVAFNVPGLAWEFFIPPSDVHHNTTSSIKEPSSCSPLHDTSDNDDDDDDDNEKAFREKML